MLRRLPFLRVVLFNLVVLSCWLLYGGLPVSYAPVTWAHYATPQSYQRVVIRSQKEMDAWWAANTTHYVTPQPAPVIDFKREGVAVAAMGSCATSGYGISITSIHETLDTLEIAVSDHGPRFLGSVRCAVTHPYDIVRFKSVGKPFRFVDSDRSWKGMILSGSAGVGAVLWFQAWRRRREVSKAAAARRT